MTLSEIEFVCANSNFPKYREILSNHLALYAILKGRRGIYPYRQDNGDWSHREYALAVIVESPALKQKVLAAAKSVGLQVDLIQDCPEWKLNWILQGRYEGQIK